MRDIAASVGMTVGTLYYYFENKPALLGFCQHETLSQLLALTADPAIASKPADERLHHVIEGHVICLLDRMPGSIAHLTLEPLSETDRRACIARRDQYEAALREIVREGAESGVFRRVDPRLSTWTILGAVNGTAAWFRPHGDYSARSVATAMADQLVAGLLAPEAARRSADPPPHADDAGRHASPMLQWNPPGPSARHDGRSP